MTRYLIPINCLGAKLRDYRTCGVLMAKKFMKELMVMVLIELIIFKLVKVQANDLQPLRLLRSREPKSGENEPQPPLLRCLENKINKCKTKYVLESNQFMGCMIHHFYLCFLKHSTHRKGRDKIIFYLRKKCMGLCFDEPIPTIPRAICLLECYEKLIKPLTFKHP